MSFEMEQLHQSLQLEKDRATMWMRMYMDLVNRLDDLAEHVEVEMVRATNGIEEIRDQYPEEFWHLPKALDDPHS